MHVTARVAGREEVDVEVGEACRTIQALKEAVVVALPQLRVEGFDVSVGGRALDDEGVVSLEHGACLDVVPDTRGLAVEALREAGREVSEAGLLAAAREGDDDRGMSLRFGYIPREYIKEADGLANKAMDRTKREATEYLPEELPTDRALTEAIS